MRGAIVRYKAQYGGLGEAGQGVEELDVPEIQGGKAVGFIYRLVEPEVISQWLDRSGKGSMSIEARSAVTKMVKERSLRNMPRRDGAECWFLCKEALLCFSQNLEFS